MNDTVLLYTSALREGPPVQTRVQKKVFKNRKKFLTKGKQRAII